MSSPLVEPLETRIAPATLLVLNDSDQLLRFNSATPGTIAATVAIASLGGSEDVVGIDFRPATGVLYGLGLDGTTARLLTIDPITGATAQIGATFTVSGTSFGFDFNPVADRLRVVSDADQNLSINPADGVVTTQTALNPGTPNVVGAAYSNSFPGATSTTLYAIDSGTDVLATITPPADGTLATVGALGADTTDVAGFDIGHGKSEAFAALRVGGSSQLYTINLTAGTATVAGAIGTGTPAIRGLAVVQHTWDGDGGNNQWSNAANWVAGIVPVDGDAVLFPDGPANRDVFYNLTPANRVFDSLRFTGGGYTFISGGNSMVLQGGLSLHAAGAVTLNNVIDLRGSTAGVDSILVEPAGAELALAGLIADANAGRGLDMLGAGKVRVTGQFNAAGSAVQLHVNGPQLIVDGFFLATGITALDSGAIEVNGSISAPLTVNGGTLRGGGSTGTVTATGGTIESGATSLATGDLTLGAAATAAFLLPAGAAFDPLSVTGTVALGGAQLAVTPAGSAPAKFTLLLNDGTDAIGGIFAGLVEGASVPVGAENYAISYLGGDGNDVTLTRTGGPVVGLVGNTATFTDVDGDAVTIKVSSTGTLTTDHFFLRDAGGDRAQLELIDLANDPAFAGANITITAQRSATLGGDGSVNIGRIDATKIDLGKVAIPGDLGAIDAGDGVSATSAIKALTVQSLGVFGFGTGAPDLLSNINGRVDKLTIRGDLRGARVEITDSSVPGDANASIGALTIGGSIFGGAAADSGVITAKDNIFAVKIGGDIVGGGGNRSGLLEVQDSFGAVTIMGSIFGGAGVGSGKLVASTDSAVSVKIGGDIVGGGGLGSGGVDIDDADTPTLKSFTLVGSLIGGAGGSSGRIAIDDDLGSFLIGGSMIGVGESSAQVDLSGDNAKSIVVRGSIVGGAGASSAQLRFNKDVGSLTIGGSVVGGGGSFSAQVDVGGKLGKLHLGGSLLGGAGTSTAQIEIDELKAGTIGGTISGGAGNFSGHFEADDSLGSLTVGAITGGTGTDSGIVIGDNFGKLTVRGDLLGGVGDRSGRIFVTSGGLTALGIGGSIRSGTGAATGGVFVSGALGPMTVGGEILGTGDDAVTIAAGGEVPVGGSPAIGIASLSVKGGVTHARILAGYDEDLTARNADAQIGKVTVGGDWIASSIAAGVQDDATAALNAFFGDADDRKIQGAGTTNDAALTSKIASIVIKGQALGTAAAGDHFGFVAQEIGALTIGAVKFPLTKNLPAGNPDDPDANDPLLLIGSTGDLRVHEVAL